MRGRIVVDESVLRKNFLAVKKKVGKGKKTIAVLKADGYGHGGAVAARACRGSSYFAVASADEGEILSEEAEETRGKIFVLGETDGEEKARCVRLGIGFAVQSAEDAESAQREGRALGVPVGIHVALDTGMNRIGMTSEKEVYNAINTIKSCKNLRLLSVFSHLADVSDEGFCARQRRRFLSLSTPFSETFPSAFLHLSATGKLGAKDYAFDGARPGLALYGYGSEGVSPCLSVTDRVVRNSYLPAGESAGYGRRFVARRGTFVATLSLGYADGIPRSLSGGCVLLGGKRRRIVGNICMDSCFCLSDEGVRVGDEVVFLGSSGGQTLTAEDVALAAGTVPYEILTGWKRLPVVRLPGG